MKAQIDSYQSFPGDHCGSVAMRGLLNHYCGLNLPEAAVFGLGAGLGSVYLAREKQDPAVLLFGRTMTMELDIGWALGLDYREQAEDDNAKAWELVKQEIIAGRPTMLTGDIFYLDYREFKYRFPGHRFVLLGFDDQTESVAIADRIRPEAEICSYRALAESRNPADSVSPANVWGRFYTTKPERSLVEASRFALDLCCARMFGEDSHEIELMTKDSSYTSGIAGVKRLAEELPTWAQREDRQWLATYNAMVIEKFGNGGGNFRLLYAGFLEWCLQLDPALVPASAPALARRAAAQWTVLSSLLAAAAEENAVSEAFYLAGQQAMTIVATEQQLFEMLR
jgi:hypothetical protein